MKDHSLDSTDLTWLSGLARALIREPHAADDLVQETAVAAIEGAMPTDELKRPWLAGVARRLAARRHRTDSRRSHREADSARPDSLPDSAELVEKAEVAEHVTAAARRLPEPYRRTILLRFLEGRTTEEIAREEGKPTDTVRWRVRRGLDLLRDELVQKHDRDWSSWSVLLVPLARPHVDAGLATAGASGVLSGMVVSVAVMKASFAVVVVLGIAGIWFAMESVTGESGVERVAVDSPATEVARETPTLESDAELASVDAGPSRSAPADSAPIPPPEVEPKPSGFLAGRVVDEDGGPVPGATVYLLPTTTDGQARPETGPVRARTESGTKGTFQFTRDEWQSDADESFELGVNANGYLRTVLPDVLASGPRTDLTVVLRRGRTIAGRVIDELGQPVAGLRLLVYTAYAPITHVSPSQRSLRAERSDLAGASSKYEQSRATTDGRGEVEFTGLPNGDLYVTPLDPGWTIEESRQVEADGTYIVWTVKGCPGVRLVVTEAGTSQPVERASATFRVGVTFADGEEREFGQWVGRGAGEVSFELTDELMPGLEERTITRASFYGTVRAGDGDPIAWMADALADSNGVRGVVEVEVQADSRPAIAKAEDEDVDAEELGTARLTLDVRYDDSTPFEGALDVAWTSKRNSKIDGDEEVEPEGIGRYALDIAAGPVALDVRPRGASGSLPAWKGEVSTRPDGTATAFVTLPRGASATITRPDGWRGEWFLHASWRPPGEERWRGSLGYSSAGTSMTLSVLRPAEWKFELRRDSALERDPIVRTVVLEVGDSKTVGE